MSAYFSKAFTWALAVRLQRATTMQRRVLMIVCFMLFQVFKLFV